MWDIMKIINFTWGCNESDENNLVLKPMETTITQKDHHGIDTSFHAQVDFV
jgi:hypothetical protein